MQFELYADGGARGNPGPAGAGAVVRDSNGNTVLEVSKFLGHQTNNFAEYDAVISALDGLSREVATPREVTVLVKLDSQLVVKQMTGEYKVKHPNIRPQYEKLVALVRLFKNVTFTHVPREQNKDADRLANQAMDRGA